MGTKISTNSLSLVAELKQAFKGLKPFIEEAQGGVVILVGKKPHREGTKYRNWDKIIIAIIDMKGTASPKTLYYRNTIHSFTLFNDVMEEGLEELTVRVKDANWANKPLAKGIVPIISGASKTIYVDISNEFNSITFERNTDKVPLFSHRGHTYIADISEAWNELDRVEQEREKSLSLSLVEETLFGKIEEEEEPNTKEEITLQEEVIEMINETSDLLDLPNSELSTQVKYQNMATIKGYKPSYHLLLGSGETAGISKGISEYEHDNYKHVKNRIKWMQLTIEVGTFEIRLPVTDIDGKLIVRIKKWELHYVDYDEGFVVSGELLFKFLLKHGFGVETDKPKIKPKMLTVEEYMALKEGK